MQIFATALLVAVVASNSVDIKEGDKTVFTADFDTGYKVTGEGATQTLTAHINCAISMADGVVNEQKVGDAYTYLCQGEGTEAKTCYEMKFDNDDEGDKTESYINVTSYEVPEAKYQISAANQAELTSAGRYHFKRYGNFLGESRIEKGTDGWKFRPNPVGKDMQETIDLAAAKLDKSSGNCKLTLPMATTEAGVKTAKEELAKDLTKGTIGGFYKKRAAKEGDADIKGIWGEKSVSFVFGESDAALAFSMAGAIAATALAF